MRFYRKLLDVWKDFFCTEPMEAKYGGIIEKVELQDSRDKVLNLMSEYFTATGRFWSISDRLPQDGLSDVERATRIETEWKNSPPELIEAAFDLAFHPPELMCNLDDDEFRDYMAEFMGLWASHDSALWAEKVGPLVSNVETRPLVLAVMARTGYGCNAFRPLLKPLVFDPSLLSWEEQSNLVEAVGYAGGEEAVQLLSQLATHIEPTRHEMLREIERTKKWVTERMNGV
jgi:hypothetical protein